MFSFEDVLEFKIKPSRTIYIIFNSFHEDNNCGHPNWFALDLFFGVIVS